MAGDAKRDDKGRVQPGNSLRKSAQKTRAKVIRRRLMSEYIRRYADAPIDPANPKGEKFGKERATLKHYFVCMDIMQDTGHAPKDRLKAAEILANRVDGKPVDEVELSGSVETGSPLEKALVGATPEQLLEIVRTARGH